MSAAEKEADDGKKAKQSGGLWETFKIVIQALILALLVRTFLFQPFSIPSGSMEDTLLVGDFLFVSKYSYGYSRYSFPFAPDIFGDGRIFASDPERGDIVVFKGQDGDTDYIKRLIGLPGDRIQMLNGVLNINGDAVEMELITGDGDGEQFSRELRYMETLPNGVSYEILDRFRNGSYDNTQEFLVPDGHYFFMGDNRDNSTDSRAPVSISNIGFVPFENLIGRGEIIFFSVEEDARAWEFWRWPWTVRGERLFDGI